MASITTTCPHCKTNNCQFQMVSEPYRSDNGNYGGIGGFVAQAAFKCGSCSQLIIGVMEVTSAMGFENFKVLSQSDINFTNFRDPGKTIRLLAQFPPIQKGTCPSHCPENVERAFNEAEKALRAGAHSLAAAGFRKSIERAISPFLPEGSKARMLGPKLGELEKSNLLPEAMLEWIRIVKDDGNFAMHDEDRDFETAEEVEPTRLFTHTLLQYLFTLPDELKAAREKIEARK